MTTTSESQRTLTAHPIDPARLDDVRRKGEDTAGNPFTVVAATGDGEPLRCCLRFARPGEKIALISYAPFVEQSVWREVGPVYVHADACQGHEPSRLPEELRRGPRVLRAYRGDGTMSYEHNTLVGDEDLEPELHRLLAHLDVATVHVRTVLPQCFLYAVTR